jgi:hypothetical protein
MYKVAAAWSVLPVGVLSMVVDAVEMVDLDGLPASDREAVAEVCREMDRLGFEITAIVRPSGVSQWQVQWRPRDIEVRAACFGACGVTVEMAARTALANAVSSLG